MNQSAESLTELSAVSAQRIATVSEVRTHALVAALARRSEADVAGLLPAFDNLSRRFLAAVDALKSIDDSDLDTLLDAMVRQISIGVGADRSSLFLFESQQGELVARVAQGTQAALVRLPPNVGIAGWVYRNNQAVRIDDAQSNPRFDSSVDKRTGYQTQSILCAPIRLADGATIGVAQALNAASGKFGLADEVLLEALLEYWAPALQLAHETRRADEASASAGRLMAITRDLARTSDSERLLTEIVEAASELVNAERATLFLHDPLREELYSRVAQGMADEEIRIPASSGIAGHSFITGTPQNISNPESDPHFNGSIQALLGYVTRSVLAVPVLGRTGEPLGVLECLNHQNGQFSLSDQIRLEALAAQATIVLEHVELVRQNEQAHRFADGILEALDIAVITVSAKGRVSSLNPAAETLFDAPLARNSGLPLAELLGAVPASLDAALARVARTGAPETVQHIEIHTADGQRLNSNVYLAPFERAGKPAGQILVFHKAPDPTEIEQNLSRYLPVPASDFSLDNAGQVRGATRRATVLFCDICGFTRITEKLGAQQTVTWLNAFFGVMGDVIQTHGGHIDKFIGDAIMAVFGMREAANDDADRALLCALEMQQRLIALNAEFSASGLPELQIRIGINTDDVVVGTIGSHDRLSYTVIGDGVNVAARLQGVSKHYGTRILYSKSTADALADPQTFCARKLDLVQVAGRATLVEAFELMALAESPEARDMRMLARRYEVGRKALAENRPLDACTVFAELSEWRPDDRSTRVMLERAIGAMHTGDCAGALINDLSGADL